MVAVLTIDSNVTSLRYAEELTYKVLPGTPEWIPLEPNSYSDFGGQITTVARNPINESRQRKKGVTTDLDASGGFNTDLTQTNLKDLLQGFFWADLREKPTNEPNNGGAGFVVSNVDGTTEDYDTAGDWTAAPAGFLVGDLLFAEGFTDPANNGLKEVTVVVATALTVAENLVDEPAPPATASVRQVGFQFAAGDADIDAAGSRPALTSTVKDLTDFGLIPGEWIFIGGDVSGGAGDQFLTAVNNGFARVFSVTATRMEFDKTSATMATEASTVETIRIFFGTVLKNENTRTGSNAIVRRSYNLERQLGLPDTTDVNNQSEYITGAIPNELTLNIGTADKVTVDLTFVGADSEQRTSATGVKSGNRPALEEADAFNTSSDFSRIRLAKYEAADAFPTALFASIQELTLTINNNATVNKRVGTLGGFEVTAGNFEVGGSITAYFTDVAGVTAVRDNDDVTLDVHLVRANAGITFDIMLITLGDGRPNVEQDAPITLPLSNEAATGAKLDATLDHTLLMMFWEFLPNAADV